MSKKQSSTAKKKDPSAVRLGRKGGLAKVPKGTSMLSKRERVRIAKLGAAARWPSKEVKP